MNKKLLIVYLAVCAGELMAVAIHFELLEWIFKPLIMITLGAYYYTSVIGVESTYSKPVIGAILFSLGGDIALMFQGHNEVYFIAGLASFLIANLCYLLAYNQHKGAIDGNVLIGIQKFRFALPIVLAGTGLITILYTHLGDLRVPVIMYSLVLIIMVLQSLFRYGHTNSKSFWFVFVGAMLFMLSDSLIAINKFLLTFELAHLAIMVTYMFAQLLIISGLVRHENK